jgi:hypothetical protein
VIFQDTLEVVVTLPSGRIGRERECGGGIGGGYRRYYVLK